MKAPTKYACIYALTLVVLVMMATSLAQAQSEVPPPPEQFEVEDPAAQDIESEPLDQAEVDQMLAPIALYPDSLLSHILVASTYPLEVIQAARWRDQNADLDAEAAREAVQDREWDPSVKALVPFKDLLNQMSDDLDWLQRLGDAFLLNEDQLLNSVQALRRKAYDRGTLSNNEYIEVVEEDNDLIIEPVQREVVYVPYYDTRVVYGPWWWHHRAPLFWHHPGHFYSYAGFYWGPRIFVRPHFYFGGFHWRRRHTVISHHVFHHGPRYNDGIRRVHVREYPRWKHNPGHRRGARYHHAVNKQVFRNNQSRVSQARVNTQRARQDVVRTREVHNYRARNEVVTRTRNKLQQRPVRLSEPRQQVENRIRKAESGNRLHTQDRRRETAGSTKKPRVVKRSAQQQNYAKPRTQRPRQQVENRIRKAESGNRVRTQDRRRETAGSTNKPRVVKRSAQQQNYAKTRTQQPRKYNQQRPARTSRPASKPVKSSRAPSRTRTVERSGQRVRRN